MLLVDTLVVRLLVAEGVSFFLLLGTTTFVGLLKGGGVVFCEGGGGAAGVNFLAAAGDF